MSVDPTAIPYRVFVRDESLLLVAEIDSYSELQCERRFNEVGGWTMTIAADVPAVALLAEADSSGRLVGERRGIVVLDEDGGVVFSGVATEVERRGDGYDEARAASGDVLELSGACDNAFLARRVVRPDAAGPPYASDYDERTGLADDLLVGYVDSTMGTVATSSGHPERTMPGLIIPAHSGLGTTVTWRARFDNLLELCQAVAAAGGGLRFEVVQYDLVNGLVQFVVTLPADKTATVVFDPETGTLSSRTRTEAAPSANYVIALAGGEGTQRAMTERGDPDSITRYGLREAVVDVRETDDTGVAGQRIDELLETSRESISVEVDAIDTDQVRYGRDYGLGDRVTCRVRLDADTVEETVGYVGAITLRIDRATAAEGGVGMIRPTITTLGAVVSRGGVIGGRAGGLAGYLSRNMESETPGTVKLWAGEIAEIPPRYQYMNGTAGTTDMRGRFLVGADGDAGGGGDYPLFDTGGAASQLVTLAHTHTGAAHTHPGSHSHTVNAHSHTGAAHTHPGSHTHPVAAHSHTGAAHTHPGSHSHGMSNHNHTVDIDHNHPNQTIRSAVVFETGSGGGTDLDTTVNLTHGGTDKVARDQHTHNVSVDLNALGSAPVASGNQSSGGNSTNADSNVFAASFSASTGTTALTTDADSNAPAASYSGDTGTTGLTTNTDSTAHAASYSGQTGSSLADTTVDTIPPYRGLLFVQRIAVA